MSDLTPTTPTQAELHQLANMLEEVAKLLRPKTGPGVDAFVLALDWSGRLAATAASDGSRSTGHNDLSSKVVTPGEDDINDKRPNATIRVPAEFEDAHQRLIANTAAMRKAVGPMVRDLTFCQRSVEAKREAANNLDRINSRTGECEACYTAGVTDSYQRGTLESVILATFTTNKDGETVHDQFDLCRRCAVSAHGSRAGARSKGEDWDPDEWMTKRIDYLRAGTTNIGAGAPAA